MGASSGPPAASTATASGAIVRCGAARKPARRAARGPFDTVRSTAAALPAATEDIKWGADLCLSVGGKMFAVFLLRDGGAVTCAFKVDDDRFVELTGVPGVKPAPYLARARWVQVEPGHALPAADLAALVRRSHALVAARLTRKQRAELGL